MVTNSWHGHVIIANRYHLLRPLGHGGMGSVVLARDTRFNQRFVALKENLERSPGAREQFQWEAEVLATLTHPHLPAVTDHFTTADGRQFLVMNYIEGETLEERVGRVGMLGELDALLWLGQVLDALHYLHTQPQPIIHRDVKPANIRITPEGRAVLVDFGISKIMVPGQQTVTVARAGSPGYAPPEQYTGGTDARSDVYAAGATLYFALTGQEPPESPALASGYALARPREINNAISGRTEKAILGAMHPEMARRYQSARAFHTALGDPTMRLAQNGAPTGGLARVTGRLSEQLPGHLWAWIGGAVALLVLIVAGSVLLSGGGGRAAQPGTSPTSVPTVTAATYTPVATATRPPAMTPTPTVVRKATSTPL
ncbi:MAG: serine/threonine protein kinase, partial [Anaerolineae bacterium]|nr:serine/threonine protein kinase [Anaerolineae bacterium]